MIYPKMVISDNEVINSIVLIVLKVDGVNVSCSLGI